MSRIGKSALALIVAPWSVIAVEVKQESSTGDPASLQKKDQQGCAQAPANNQFRTCKPHSAHSASTLMASTRQPFLFAIDHDDQRTDTDNGGGGESAEEDPPARCWRTAVCASPSAPRLCSSPLTPTPAPVLAVNADVWLHRR